MKLQSAELLGKVELFLERVLGPLMLQIHFNCHLERGVMHVDLQGEDSEWLLTDNARLLYAINHLLNQIYYRRSQERCSFLVDCNGYRSSRELELRLLARKAAQEVRASGRPLELQPMPAGERRIIHLTLSEEVGVRTASEGGGQWRRVVIQTTP